MKIKLAIVQTNPVFGQVESNIEQALALMESISADFYVLPELFNTGYNFSSMEELEKLTESVQGATYTVMYAFARQRGCCVVYGFAEADDDSFYNSAALVGPEGLIGIYRKVHLFNRENIFFKRGNLGFPVFDTPLGKIGLMICFDWFFPESARTLALKGAQLIAHPSNLVLPYCPDAMVTRCLENRVFAATANRIGTEDRGGFKFTFIGKSEIVTPKGEILTRLPDDQAAATLVQVDLEEALNKRINEYNDIFRDREKGFYL